MISPRPRPALSSARLYLCTDSRRAQGDLADFLDAVLPAGVDVVQLRQKNLEAADEIEVLDVMAQACARHGRLLAVNDRADVAATAGAQVLHVGQRDLTPRQARAIVGPDVIIGRSSHSVAEAEGAASDPDVDYFCVGPVWATPTKPGRPHIGLDPVRTVAGGRFEAGKPWFAIGGIDESTVADVLDAGAQRVVVVRVLTEASDPAAVTARLAARLAENAEASGAVRSAG